MLSRRKATGRCEGRGRGVVSEGLGSVARYGTGGGAKAPDDEANGFVGEEIKSNQYFGSITRFIIVADSHKDEVRKKHLLQERTGAKVGDVQTPETHTYIENGHPPLALSDSRMYQ